MKVLHVIPSVSPLRGGPSVMLRTITRELVQAGVAVDVATTDDNGPGRLNVVVAEPVVQDEVTYRYFPRQTRFYSFSWPLTCWLGRHIVDYDLVHIHALFSYVSISAAFLAKRYRVPYIVRPLGVLNRWGMRTRRPWLKQVSFRLIERRILAGAAAVHYTSEQESLEAAELEIAHRPVIIPNAIEIPPEATSYARGRFRERYPELASRPIILFLSRIDQKKGLDLLLPAFADIVKQHPRAALVIAGNGEPAFVEALKREATRIGIAREIVWTGFLSDDEKWAALLDADVFVLPSYSENFGIAVAESLACGLPVVVSRHVAIHREISELAAGLVVPCEPALLAKAVGKLLADNGLRIAMGNAARRCARTKFSLKFTTQQLVSLYQDITTPAFSGT
jgi:glycosyltransferase involved in cell wall biosynthesis